MGGRVYWAFAAVIGLWVTFEPGTAEGCSPCACDSAPRILPVVDDAAELPLNARFLVDMELPTGGKVYPFDDLSWKKTYSSDAVEFEVEDSGDGHRFWLIPKEPLLAETRYTIELEGVTSRSFHTGSREDHAPPSASETQANLPGEDLGCFERHSATLSWSSITDGDFALGYKPIVEVAVQGKIAPRASWSARNSGVAKGRSC